MLMRINVFPRAVASASAWLYHCHTDVAFLGDHLMGRRTWVCNYTTRACPTTQAAALAECVEFMTKCGYKNCAVFNPKIMGVLVGSDRRNAVVKALRNSTHIRRPYALNTALNSSPFSVRGIWPEFGKRYTDCNDLKQLATSIYSSV